MTTATYDQILALKTAQVNTPCDNPKDQAVSDNNANFDRLFREEGHTAPCALATVFQGKTCVCKGDPQPEPEIVQVKPLSDNGKAFFLSVSLACLAEVMAGEKGDTQRSIVKRKKLRSLQGDLVKATRLYTPEGFEYRDMRVAEDVFDQTNALIHAAYPE